MSSQAATAFVQQPAIIEQGSPEWFALRCGKVTASRISDLMAKARTPGKGVRANYMAQIMLERMTGVPGKTYQNATMEEGNQWEPKARAAYIFMTGFSVSKVAFVDHPDVPKSGCSPDGFVSTDGLLEIKCPFANTHFTTLTDGEVPDEYMKQMQWALACTGRAWCDYVSYNDDMPENMKLFIKRVPRSNQMIGELTDAVRSFQTEVDLRLSVLREKFP
jgi:putative phage-type endonuclease